MEPAIVPTRPTVSSHTVSLSVVSCDHHPFRRDAPSRPLSRLRARHRRHQLAPGLRSRSQHRLDSFQSPRCVRLMNAVPSRMPALDRAPSLSPSFNSFADVAHTTLYDLIGNSIGGDAADKLIADFGGRRLYIPMAPAPGGLITRSIGLLAALAMARAFGGDRLMIPVASDHSADGSGLSRCAPSTSASRASRMSCDAPSATCTRSSR